MPRGAALAIVVTATLGAAACGGSTPATPRAVRRPAHVRPAAVVRPGHRLLMVSNRDGVVAVDSANGQVTFRAPFGAAAPDGTAIVQAEPIAAGTRVVASDPRSGSVRWSHDVSGERRVRVVAPHAAFVALVDSTLSTASDPRPSTKIDVVTARGARAMKLAGNLDPEAFSVDGRYLFVLQYTPPNNPTRYSVRRLDLRTNRIEPVPDQNGDTRSSMSGYSRTQLMSPDGTKLYTFYASAEPIHEDGETYHAFVHVLNLAKGWAHCVDLDERIGATSEVTPSLAVSPDGATLYATDGQSGLTAVIDTKALRTRRVIPTPVDAGNQLFATTSSNALFLAHDDSIERFTTSGPRTDQRPTYVQGNVSALASDPERGVVYVATERNLLALAPDGRTVARWPSPGDATSIDPAVIVPGSGAYRCAC